MNSTISINNIVGQRCVKEVCNLVCNTEVRTVHNSLDCQQTKETDDKNGSKSMNPMRSCLQLSVTSSIGQHGMYSTYYPT